VIEGHFAELEVFVRRYTGELHFDFLRKLELTSVLVNHFGALD